MEISVNFIKVPRVSSKLHNLQRSSMKFRKMRELQAKFAEFLCVPINFRKKKLEHSEIPISSEKSEDFQKVEKILEVTLSS